MWAWRGDLGVGVGVFSVWAFYIRTLECCVREVLLC